MLDPKLLTPNKFGGETCHWIWGKVRWFKGWLENQFFLGRRDFGHSSLQTNLKRPLNPLPPSKFGPTRVPQKKLGEKLPLNQTRFFKGWSNPFLGRLAFLRNLNSLGVRKGFGSPQFYKEFCHLNFHLLFLPFPSFFNNQRNLLTYLLTLPFKFLSILFNLLIVAGDPGINSWFGGI